MIGIFISITIVKGYGRMETICDPRFCKINIIEISLFSQIHYIILTIY
jgi:hypothetical protein